MSVNELAADVGFDALSAVIHETAVDKGFWPYKYYEGEQGRGNVTDEAIGMKLALVHSEVTEVLEAVRKNKGQQEVVEEIADILIRTFDLYAALKNTGQVDDSLDDVVQLKMKKNELRPHKHGNNF